MSNQWVDFGKLLTKKGKEKEYTLQITEGLTVKVTGKDYKGNPIDVTLKGGDYLVVNRPQDEANRLYEFGKITEEQRDDRLSKIPGYIKMIFKIGPKE